MDPELEAMIERISVKAYNKGASSAAETFERMAERHIDKSNKYDVMTVGRFFDMIEIVASEIKNNPITKL